VRGRGGSLAPLFSSGSGNVPPNYEVVLRGWRPGLRKISLADALVEYAGLPLPEAKHLVDRLLAGEAVRVTIVGHPPQAVTATLREIGVKIESEAAHETTY
jgi:hypothetical protein